MRLTTLSDPILLMEQHLLDGRTTLRESCDGLTPEQRSIVEGIYQEFIPLIEASLTADQIKQIFGAVEQQAVAGGGSRTIAGKGMDVAKKANEIINNVGKWLQDTTPVKMADQKFEQLKAKVSAKFPDLDQQLTGLGTWMKENPGKSAAVIGVLTALASLAGGPVGGAIAGQVLRGASGLIKGEQLSTAVGQGIKTAALGYITGKAFELLGNYAAGLREKVLAVGPDDAGLTNVSYGATRTIDAGWLKTSDHIKGFNVTVYPEERQAIEQAIDMIKNHSPGGFDRLKDLATYVNSSEYRAAMKDALGSAQAAQYNNDSLLQWINGAAKVGQALSQGAIAAGSTVDKTKKESHYLQTRPLSEGQVYMLIDRVLTEAGFLDRAKELGSKALGAVAKGAAWAGKQATERVTSAKLLAAWKLEGSPTDSQALRKFLLDFGGIDPAIIDKVYKDMKLPVGDDTAPTATVYAQVRDAVNQLNTTQRKRLVAMLQKQLGTV